MLNSASLPPKVTNRSLSPSPSASKSAASLMSCGFAVLKGWSDDNTSCPFCCIYSWLCCPFAAQKKTSSFPSPFTSAIAIRGPVSLKPKVSSGSLFRSMNSLLIYVAGSTGVADSSIRGWPKVLAIEGTLSSASFHLQVSVLLALTCFKTCLFPSGQSICTSTR